MNTSLAWLNSYLDRPVDVEEAETLLTNAGFPFDGLETHDLSDGSDTEMDVEVTSNRSDCLSHVGLAREVSATSGRALGEPDCSLPPGGAEPAEQFATVRNEETGLCPIYTARVIRGVKIAPSPQWMINRLAAIGQPTVNNVVDITNYVLHELGQPLHAFDMARLRENTIVVRRATEGEEFEAIDHTKHKLRSDMLVIADAEVPVAIAGVMGGVDSEVTESTTDILLESAQFEMLSVRTTSRALKLQSDSSFRFERGVDPNGVDKASCRAAQLIVELAGGTLAKGVIRTGADAAQPRTITMRIQRCLDLLGINVPIDRMMELLSPLQLQPQLSDDQSTITCTIPTFRLDLEREIDLIEEVARLHGYDHIDVQSKIHIEARPLQKDIAARQRLDEVLTAHGLHETISFSFVKPKQGNPFLPEGEDALMIGDERRKAEPMLRPSLLPSLLTCRKINQDAGNSAVRLYEAASTWTRKNDGVIERERLSILCDVGESADVSLRDLRGTIEEMLQHLIGDALVTFEPLNSTIYSTGASVKLNGDSIGSIGLVSSDTSNLFDLQNQVVVAELDAPVLVGAYPPSRSVSQLPKYPAIERDLSIVVAEDVRWDTVEQIVRDLKPDMMDELQFITVYRGKQLGKGKKSVSFRMTFRDPQTTLRHEQVDPQVAQVVDALKSKLNAELRG